MIIATKKLGEGFYITTESGKEVFLEITAITNSGVEVSVKTDSTVETHFLQNPKTASSDRGDSSRAALESKY